jgi:hypothetical protein
MPKLKMNAYERGGKSLKFITEHNLAHAKDVINKGNSFSPSLFVITEKNLYYILLDTQLAESMKASPMDQVKPMIQGFLENAKLMGKMEAYQVIGEAWMKAFKMDSNAHKSLNYGDIAKMASRVEVLMDVIVTKGKKHKFRTFKMIREENSEKVIEFKPMTGGNMGSPKFPIIPKVSDTWTGRLEK